MTVVNESLIFCSLEVTCGSSWRWRINWYLDRFLPQFLIILSILHALLDFSNRDFMLLFLLILAEAVYKTSTEKLIENFAVFSGTPKFQNF